MTIKSSTRVLLSFFPPLSRLVISSTLTYLAISFFFFAALIVPIRTDFCAVLCLKFIRHGLRDIRGSCAQFSVTCRNLWTDICAQKYEQKSRKKDEDDESMILLKEKEAKECVVTSVESLFASYLLTGRELFARVIKVFWWHVTTILRSRRNSAINKILPSPHRVSNRIDSTFYVSLDLAGREIYLIHRTEEEIGKGDWEETEDREISRTSYPHDVLPCSSPTLLRIWLTHFHSHEREALES